MLNYFRQLLQSDRFANRICSDGTIQPTQALRDAHNARINAHRAREREQAEEGDGMRRAVASLSRELRPHRG